MKKKYFIILILLFSTVCFSQKKVLDISPKYPQLFKTIPTIFEDDPNWVKLMYSENPNYNAIQIAYDEYYKIHVLEKTIHTQNYKHFMGAIFLNDFVKEDGSIYRPTIAEQKERRKALKTNYKFSNRGVANWSFIGPKDTYSNNGSVKQSRQVNVYTVEQSISDPNILIAGTETGAVFISTDKGDNWTVTADELVLGSRTIGAVAIDPLVSSTMYIASGAFLYKSLDAGASWTDVHAVSQLNLTDISINPINSMEILTAGRQGLYRSTDGGATWDLILSDGRAWDIERKVDDPKTVFVAQTNPGNNVVEIYKANDITVLAPVFQAKTVGYFSPTNTTAQNAGGARIAVTNADPDRLYVLLLGNDINYATDTNFLGIYKSIDAGESWTLPYDGDGDGNPDNDPGGPYSATDWCMSCFGFGDTLTGGGTYDQGFYNAGIGVSDTDPDTFLVGMLSMFLSTDGATTFTPWGGYICDGCGGGYRHPDIQEIEINGSDLWVATDGGLDLYSAADFNLITSKNNGMNATEYWGFGQAWQEDVIVGGRYHNGNAAYRPAYNDGKFKALGGGEAPTGYVNAIQSQVASFSDIRDKKIPQSLTEAATNAPINASLYPNQQIYDLKKRSEVVYDSRWGSVNYLGRGNKLWKTEDSGVSYNAINEFVESGNSVLVTDIEIPRSNPDYIYVTLAIADGGSNVNAKIYKSSDAGLTWTPLILPSGAGHPNMEIQVATDNENEVYISFGNGGSNINKVFLSIDGGASWNNLTTATLEGSVAHLIIQDGTDGGIYAITNKDVYYRNNSMTDWEVYGQGLPTKKDFNKLIPFYRDGKLRGATYNRGMVETPLFENSKPIAQPITTVNKLYCSREDVQFEDYSILNYAGASWQWSFPGSSSVSSTTVRNPIVRYDTPGMYDVTLTVTDGNGETNTKTVVGMIEFVEDLCTTVVENVGMAFQTTKGAVRCLVDDDFGLTNIQNITVAGWFKPTDTQDDVAGLFSANNSTGGSFALNLRATNELMIHWNGAQWWRSTGLFVEPDKWNYIALVSDPAGVTLYLNEEKTFIDFVLPAINLDDFYIGSHIGLWYRNYNGLVEELKVWDRSLTEEEIRLERHLIETDISEANLQAYWQFNDLIGGNLVYDKKSTRDVARTGAVDVVNSTAPIASGNVQKLNITTSGMANFSSAGIKIDFVGTVPDGDVYVFELNSNPDQLPATNLIEDKYYVINNYGINSVFSALTSIEFINVGNLASVTSGAEVHLFKRNSNEDLNTWPGIPDAITTTYNAGENNVTFASPDITSFSQFYLGSNATLGIDEVESGEIGVYPNPIKNDEFLQFKNINEDFIFTLYDITGKMVSKSVIANNQYQVNELASGVYLYRIETVTKIINKKIVISE